MASMLEIMVKGAEMVNAEEEFVDQVVELDLRMQSFLTHLQPTTTQLV